MRAVISYEGVTTAVGAATGDTLVDAGLASEPSYAGLSVKILGGGAAGQVGFVTTHVGGTLAVSTPFTDAAGAVQQIVAGTPFVILSPNGGAPRIIELLEAVLRQNPLESFWEPWQDEVVGIDPNWWATQVVGTGAVTRDVTENGVLKVLLNCPAGGDRARLRSVQRWRLDPANFRANSVVRKLRVRWRAKVNDLANIDNGIFLMGLTPATTSTRVAINVAVFGLVADAISSITDLNGGETVNDLSAGLDFTQWLLFQQEVYRLGTLDCVRFTVSDAAGVTNTATHVTNIPVRSMYLNYVLDSEAAVAAGLHIGEIHAAYYDHTLA